MPARRNRPVSSNVGRLAAGNQFFADDAADIILGQVAKWLRTRPKRRVVRGAKVRLYPFLPAPVALLHRPCVRHIHDQSFSVFNQPPNPALKRTEYGRLVLR